MGGFRVAQEQENDGKNDVRLRVADVMVKDVITIGENASVKEAADIMNKFEVSSIIAAKEGKATGIITESDILKRIVAEAKIARKTKVKDIMSSPLIAVAPDTNLEEAGQLMFQKKIKKLPVIDREKLVGLISLTDVARYQPGLIKLLKFCLLANNTPKSLEKVIDHYIV
jgi:CBS domain-containing protein